MAMVGYLLEQELRNVLPGRDVATLLTQVIVMREFGRNDSLIAETEPADLSNEPGIAPQ